MYSILLVEDEKSILSGLYAIVSLDEFGFDKIEFAYDGEQALNMCAKRSYDIIVTDIKMPRMDGLQLLEALRARDNKARVILITAYGEFDYVLRALRLGAYNFMLKPLDKNEFIEGIKSAICAIQNQPRDNRELAANTGETVSDYFIKRWISGDMDDLECTLRAPMAGVDLYLPEYNVILFKSLARACDGVTQLLIHTLEKNWRTWVYRSEGCDIIIIGGRDTSAARVSRELAHIADETGSSRMWLLVIGFSAMRYQDIASVVALSFRTMNYPSSYMLGALCEASDSPPARLLPHNEADDYRLLDAESDAEARALLAQAGTGRESLFPTIMGMIHTLEERCPNSCEGTAQILQEMLEAWDCSEDMFNAAAMALEKARRLSSRVKGNLSPIVARTLDIISSQYSSPLSLKTLSDTLNVHPNYLGYLFKRETGKFFSDCLNELRIHTAEGLLIDTNDNVADIAIKVGYGSVRYFNRTFKLITGMSPGKFRMRGRQ